MELHRLRLWYIKGLPELQYFPSDAELRTALSKLRGSDWTILHGFWVTGTALTIPLIGLLVFPWLGLPRWVEWALCGAVAVLATVAYIRTIMRGTARHFLRLQLIESGVPICVLCGTWFGDTREDRCPTCGLPKDAVPRSRSSMEATASDAGSKDRLIT